MSDLPDDASEQYDFSETVQKSSSTGWATLGEVARWRACRPRGNFCATPTVVGLRSYVQDSARCNDAHTVAVDSTTVGSDVEPG